MSDAERDDLLNAEGLARALGLKPATVLKWHRQKRIPARKLSHKTLRFDLTEVLAALEARPKADGQGVAS